MLFRKFAFTPIFFIAYDKNQGNLSLTMNPNYCYSFGCLPTTIFDSETLFHISDTNTLIMFFTWGCWCKNQNMSLMEKTIYEMSVLINIYGCRLFHNEMLTVFLGGKDLKTRRLI